jgi:hypothetical protein
VSSFTCSRLNDSITATYFENVHNCTPFEISDPDLGMSYRNRKVGHALTRMH